MKSRFVSGGIVVATLVAVLAADWPLFRNDPLQTGFVDAQLPATLSERWRVKTGEGIEGAPAIVDGIVYIGSIDQHLYAIRLKDGAVQWRFKAGPFKAPAAVKGDSVYIGDLDGKFLCLDAKTGAKKWEFLTDSEFTAGANFAGDQILIGSGDEHLYALTKDGKVSWKFKVPGGPVMATPAVVGERTFVAGCDSMLHVIDTRTGKEIASVDIGGQSGSTAAIFGDRLYVGTMSNQVLAIDWKKAEVVWGFESPRHQPIYASAAVTDKFVVTGCRDKHVYALDRATGKPVWDFVTGSRVDSSPVIVRDRVYIGSSDDHLYVIDLNKGGELQRIKLDGPVTGSAAVSDGNLVIGTGAGTIYCFGSK
jgi:outer membrane protein assembly factor BamB